MNSIGAARGARMAWCETCQQHVDEDHLTVDGVCPDCGGTVEQARHIPWTFKVMLAATVVYLGYRGYQGIEWLIHHA
jgi:hypothetical protein